MTLLTVCLLASLALASNPASPRLTTERSSRHACKAAESANATRAAEAPRHTCGREVAREDAWPRWSEDRSWRENVRLRDLPTRDEQQNQTGRAAFCRAGRVSSARRGRCYRHSEHRQRGERASDR